MDVKTTAGYFQRFSTLLTFATISKTPLANDYGCGFYCTRELPMAMELACKQNSDGFVNIYSLDQETLKILNLLDGNYNILHWMALLLKNRTFRLSNEIAIDAGDYIIDHFSIDLTDYDIVVGYRADDSYFSFAESFVQNGLPLRSLNQALRLGKLGEQTVLISEKAFGNGFSALLNHFLMVSAVNASTELNSYQFPPFLRINIHFYE